MSAHEIALGLAFLESTLSADSTLAGYAPGGVKRAFAPPGTPTPYVIIGFQAGSDAVTMNGVRMLVDATFQAKAVGPVNQLTAITNAAAQIDALLGGEDGLRNQTTPGGYIHAVWRQAPLWVDEGPINTVVWSNAGGLHRMQIEQSS
ncbi:MAG: hypothetical protein ACRDHW_00880 [Ktedonobacteraceae bacterium]